MTGGPGVPSGAGDGGGEGDVEADAVPAFECTPWQPACVDEGHWANCAPEGVGHGKVYACDAGTACDPCTGTCVAPFCAEGDATCVDGHRFRLCHPSGTCWLPEVHTCPTGQFCDGGACVTCIPGLPGCVDLETEGLCAEDGQTLDPVVDCADDFGCSELTGRCEPKTCAGGEAECDGIAAFHPCLPSRTGFALEAETCPEGAAVCLGAGCQDAACVPTILLLVDRSGSMTDKWDQVEESVLAVVAANPEAAFALLPFPALGGCEVVPTPDPPLGFHAPETLAAWFDAILPGGATPLAAALETVEENAAGIFGATHGSVIVLSDGEDTCYFGDVAAVLAETAQALWKDHGVSTYVIGYAFSGDSAQLDALAQAGGTGAKAHTPAGNVPELIAALQEILDRLACEGEEESPP